MCWGRSAPCCWPDAGLYAYMHVVVRLMQAGAYAQTDWAAHAAAHCPLAANLGLFASAEPEI